MYRDIFLISFSSLKIFFKEDITSHLPVSVVSSLGVGWVGSSEDVSRVGWVGFGS